MLISPGVRAKFRLGLEWIQQLYPNDTAGSKWAALVWQPLCKSPTVLVWLRARPLDRFVLGRRATVARMSRTSDVSALRLYLDAISRVPRLSRQDEIALGERIQAARIDALRALASSDLALDLNGLRLKLPLRWSALEQTLAELERRTGTGWRGANGPHDTRLAGLERAGRTLRAAVAVAREARCELVKANLRLVVAIAHKYARPAPRASLLDLIQEGNIGLLHAAGKFDPALGKGFAFYASWWIRAYMTPALYEQLSLIHLPANVQLPLRRMRRTAQRLTLALGREPTTEDLAEALDTRASAIEALRRVPFGAISLESPAPGDANTTLFDAIEDTAAEQPSDTLDRRDRMRLITNGLSALTSREQLVLRGRFGLDGEARSLRSLGFELGVTGERVRQIEVLALEKLRGDPILGTLRAHCSE